MAGQPTELGEDFTVKAFEGSNTALAAAPAAAAVPEAVPAEAPEPMAEPARADLIDLYKEAAAKYTQASGMSPKQIQVRTDAMRLMRSADEKLHNICPSWRRGDATAEEPAKHGEEPATKRAKVGEQQATLFGEVNAGLTNDELGDGLTGGGYTITQTPNVTQRLGVCFELF